MEYYARSPLEVFAIDENKNRLTGSIPYTSLIWTRRYNKPGEFSMQVLSSVYDPSWAFIVCSDRPEMGMVQKVEYSDTSTTPDGEDTVTVSGFFLEQLLYDVTFLVEETQEEVIQIEAPRNPNRGVSMGQKPVEVYWSTVNEEYVYRDPISGQIKDNDGNTVAFGGLEEVDYEWNGKRHPGSIERPDGTKIDGYWIDKMGYYTSDGGETITQVSYASASSGGTDNDRTFNVELKVGGKYFYKWNDSTLVMVTGVADSRDNTYMVQYKKWERGPKTKTVQVKGPWQRTDAGQPEEEGDSVELVIKWVRNFFLNEWQFEEPSLEGETMVLDLSLKYLGDVVYDTLGRIEAAPRVQYDFESDTTVFSVYRGEDLTQEAMQAGTVDQMPAIAPMSAKTSAFNASSLTQGYTVLEYIQGTGAQYIRLDFTPDSDTRVVLDHQLTDTQSTQAVLGSRTQMRSADQYCVYIVDGQVRTDYGSTTYSAFTAASSRVTLDKDGRVTKYGAKTQTATAATFTCPRPMTLFSVQNVNSSDGDAFSDQVDNRPAKMRLYSCQIYDGDTLARSLIPVRRQQDSAVGLYDTVTGTFFGNVGTGVFVAGPDVDLSDQLTYDANAQTYSGTTGPSAGLTGFPVEVLPNGFSVQGHVFVSWNTSPDGTGTTYMPGETYTLTDGADVLYAVWSEKEEPEDPDEPVEPDEAFPYAVFNDTWGSMYGYSASADESAYKNTSYVLYDYDAPDSFTTNGYPKPKSILAFDDENYLITTGWRIPYTTQRGYYEVTVGDDGERRQETYLDMREQDPSCDGDWPRDDQELEEAIRGDWFGFVATEEEVEAFLEGQGIPKCKAIYDGFPQSLKDAGVTDLKANYGRVYNLDTGTLNTDGYIRDYDLGDKVDWGVYKLGIQRTGRIVEVEEVYDQRGIKINLTIGDELVSLMDKIRRN